MAHDSTLSYVIVDDDEDDRFLLKMALAKAQRQLPVIEFEGGEQVLDHLRTHLASHAIESLPWLMLLDLKMQRMNGFETLSLLRTHLGLTYLPIVMVTTSEDPGTQQEALDLGASAFFTKTASQEELIRQIETCFAPWL